MITEQVIEGSLLAMAHELISSVLRHGDMVVDATLGNGHDTLFLAQCVGKTGNVIGFDIQPEAIESTQERLSEARIPADVYDLHLKSHAEISEYVSQNASAVMFNLGYLPGGDKEKITQWHSTKAALTSALSCLKRQGILTVMCYPGHRGGAEEAAAVKQLLGETDGLTSDVTLYQRYGARDTTPFLLVVAKY